VLPTTGGSRLSVVLTLAGGVLIPDAVDILRPTHSTTLITCYPYLIDTGRLVVRADLVA
jgi:hypothetical protein